MVANKFISPLGVKMTLEIPQVGEIRAGQFTHVLCDEVKKNPLLRRPFSFWDVRESTAGSDIDIIFAVRGQGTEILSRKKTGDFVGFLGPLGNHFTTPIKDNRIIFVAGGVGIVPFYLFAKQIYQINKNADITLLFGAKVKEELYDIDEFGKFPMRVKSATQDGSLGIKGLVTQLLIRELDASNENVQLYSCGPDGMLKSVTKIARERKISCQLSLETRMGCALGACRACVVAVKDGTDWRYSRVCCEGPNYDSASLQIE